MQPTSRAFIQLLRVNLQQLLGFEVSSLQVLPLLYSERLLLLSLFRTLDRLDRCHILLILLPSNVNTDTHQGDQSRCLTLAPSRPVVEITSYRCWCSENHRSWRRAILGHHWHIFALAFFYWFLDKRRDFLVWLLRLAEISCVVVLKDFHNSQPKHGWQLECG